MTRAFDRVCMPNGVCQHIVMQQSMSNAKVWHLNVDFRVPSSTRWVELCHCG